MAYERNYSKEYSTEKKKKFPKQVKLDREVWEKLEAKLKKDKKNFAWLVNQAIEEYLKKK